MSANNSNRLELSKLHLSFLILFSLLVAVVAFYLSAFKPLTLILEAKTLKKGVGTVVVEKTDSVKPYTKKFDVTDDNGLKEMYVVELRY
ncbi:MAG: hypothetical protein PHN84_05595 [Desulfuromonadaceae bacterium]|nr:hypothetical protein [Desulfuromonadaceae bacterium]